MSLFLALFGHRGRINELPLLGLERTSRRGVDTSACLASLRSTKRINLLSTRWTVKPWSGMLSQCLAPAMSSSCGACPPCFGPRSPQRHRAQIVQHAASMAFCSRRRYFCHQSNGSGADGFWHVGNYRARDDQIAFHSATAETSDPQFALNHRRRHYPSPICMSIMAILRSCC
jgi:hypothetical protein